MEEEKKTPEREEEQALPVQELPTDIPAEVRQKLAEDLNEQATEDLKQDVREAEKEEANDEEVKANPEMLTKSRLLKLLVKKQYVKLREVTEEEQPADLAELLEELDENNRLVVFRLLKKDVATEAFAYMSDEARDDLVNAFSDVELVSAIEDMSLDDAADLLEDMPAGVVKRVLEKSSRQTRESLNKLLNYPESSAGSLMTPEYVRLRQEMTVGDAFAAIRKQGENAETVYTCYVVERNRLLGVVSARSLLLSDPSTPIVDIMDDNVVTVKVTDDQEYVAREMQRYDFTAMPVLDNEGMFVGIITIDDAIDVLTDESTEDMQKMAAILPDDDATTYFGTSVWTHAKQRIPWLLILMLSATFTGMVTTHYEEAFVSLPLLVSFMPMLMDTAGNCGNQISTLMVRGLALGEVEPSDFLKVLGKELRVGSYKKGPLLSDKKMTADTDWSISSMHIKTPSQKTLIKNLSGGNQQKVILGRWLLTNPDVLLLDEPTRGIDVGAKYEIYELILQLAKQGKAVMMVSSEMPELIGICDRILVMSNGHMAGILERGKDFGGIENEQETIMRLAAQYV